MDGASRLAGVAGLQHRRCRGVLGPHQPPGLAYLRAEPAGRQLADVSAGSLLAAREHSGGVGSGVPEGDGARRRALADQAAYRKIATQWQALPTRTKRCHTKWL